MREQRANKQSRESPLQERVGLSGQESSQKARRGNLKGTLGASLGNVKHLRRRKENKFSGLDPAGSPQEGGRYLENGPGRWLAW